MDESENHYSEQDDYEEDDFEEEVVEKKPTKKQIRKIPKFKISIFLIIIIGALIKTYIHRVEIKNIKSAIKNNQYKYYIQNLELMRERHSLAVKQDWVTVIVEILLLQFSCTIYQYTQTDMLNIIILIIARYMLTVFPFSHYNIHTLWKKYPDIYYLPEFESSFPPKQILLHLVFNILIYFYETLLFTFTKLLTRRNSRKNNDDLLNASTESLKISYTSSKFFWLIHWLIITILLILIAIFYPMIASDVSKRMYLEKYQEKSALKTIRRVSRSAKYPYGQTNVAFERKLADNITIFGYKSKNIVITESMAKNYSPEIISALIAKEIGHWYNNDDIYKAILLSIPILFISLIIQVLVQFGLSDFGFGNEFPDSVIIFIIIIVSEVIFVFWTPVSSAANRSFIYKADCFASSFNVPIASAIQQFYDIPRYIPSNLYRWIYFRLPLPNERLDYIPHCKKVLWPKIIVNI